MGKKINFIKDYVRLFAENRITQAAAALCYYLSMTFFPLLIIVYSLVDHEQEAMIELLAFGEKILADDIMDFVREYFVYVDSGNYAIMMPLGLAALISYSSAALRTLEKTIGALQGGTEYKGVSFILVSIVYSLMFVAGLYFSVTLVLIGGGASGKLVVLFPGIKYYFAYIVIAGILFLILLGLYHLPKRKVDKYSVVPGAVLASVMVLLISPFFSEFIGDSAKYPLVYGSMASFILLMLWLYVCCMLLCAGAVFNICLYRTKEAGDQ